MGSLTNSGKLIEKIQNLNIDKTSTTQPSNPVAGSMYYDITNNTLMIYDGTQWNAVGGSGGGSDIFLEGITNLAKNEGIDQITLTWTEQSDLVSSDQIILARFLKSVLVRKTGGVPASAEDGQIIYTSTTPGISKTYVDTGLSAGTYYYKIFTYAKNGNITGSNSVNGTVTGTWSKTFSYTGTDQFVTIPQDGYYCANVYGAGSTAKGGYSCGCICLYNGCELAIMAGGCNQGYGGGSSSSRALSSGLSGIFNGSANISDGDRGRAIIIAGGAGGDSNQTGGVGGGCEGGYPSGYNGCSCFGWPGTQSSGATGMRGCARNGSGGKGGGGYYGGIGGGYAFAGGGGSGYIKPNCVVNGCTYSGCHSGHGCVTLCYVSGF